MISLTATKYWIHDEILGGITGRNGLGFDTRVEALARIAELEAARVDNSVHAARYSVYQMSTKAVIEHTAHVKAMQEAEDRRWAYLEDADSTFAARQHA